MKKNNFVILCLRLMGIYFGVLGLTSLPTMTSMFLTSSDRPIYFLLGPSLYIICGIVLIFYAPRLSRFMIDFSEVEENGLHITTSEKTTRIALLVLGIFIFAQSLPQLLQLSIDVCLYYASIDEVPNHLRNMQQRWTNLIGPVIKLVIAAVLIIGPDKIIGFMARHDQTFRRFKSSTEADKADKKEADDLP